MNASKLTALIAEHAANMAKYMQKSAQMKPIIGYEAELAAKGTAWFREFFGLPDTTDSLSEPFARLHDMKREAMLMQCLNTVNEMHASVPVDALQQEAVLNCVENAIGAGPTMWSHFEAMPPMLAVSRLGTTTVRAHRFVYFSAGYLRYCAALQYLDDKGSRLSKPGRPVDVSFYRNTGKWYEPTSAESVGVAANNWNMKSGRLNEGYLLAVEQVKLLGAREPESFSYDEENGTFRLTFRGKAFTQPIEADPLGVLPGKLIKSVIANGTANMLQPGDVAKILNIYKIA